MSMTHRAILALVAATAVAPLSAQTHLSTRLRYGASGITEARGGDASLTNPALAALGDQPRASATFFGLSGYGAGSLGVFRGLVGRAWGKDDEVLSAQTAKGLADFGTLGEDPSATELQWMSAHSGTMAVTFQTAAISRASWDARTLAALRGDAAGYGVPGVIDAGSTTDLAVVSSASVGLGQANAAVAGLPAWWSGVSFQASYVHLRERQIGTAIPVSTLRNEGSRLPLDAVSDDARATRMERVRLEGGWIWSAGLGGVWKLGSGTVVGAHGAHLLQLNRSRRADAYAGRTTFLIQDAAGLELERITDRITADSSAAVRNAANDLAREQRWTPTVSAGMSTDFNGPVRRLTLGVTIPLDDRPSLDNQRREAGASVEFAAAFLPKLHYVKNAERGNYLGGSWGLGSCSLRLEVAGGRESATPRREARWAGQVRVSLLQQECRSETSR